MPLVMSIFTTYMLIYLSICPRPPSLWGILQRSSAVTRVEDGGYIIHPSIHHSCIQYTRTANSNISIYYIHNVLSEYCHAWLIDWLIDWLKSVSYEKSLHYCIALFKSSVRFCSDPKSKQSYMYRQKLIGLQCTQSQDVQ